MATLVLDPRDIGKWTGTKINTQKEGKKSRMSKLKKTDGTITCERSELLDICADFYQDLYGSTRQHIQEVPNSRAQQETRKSHKSYEVK